MNLSLGENYINLLSSTANPPYLGVKSSHKTQILVNKDKHLALNKKKKDN